MKKKVALISLFSLFLLAGCDHPTDSSESTLPEWVDYSSQVTLQLDYQGKDFYKDGVGQMEEMYPIDGDTAHFTPVVKDTSSERIKCRFYGIDTPESTGKVEPWGKAASNYTKSILTEAQKNGTIVITGAIYDQYAAPQHDSTGERYLSCIYVNTEKKNAPKEEMRLLNLMIVEQGYSTARNTGEIPQLSDYFLNADTQARAYELNMFSGPDPEYNYDTEYTPTGINEIQNEVKKGWEYQLATDGQGRSLDGSEYFALVSGANGADLIWDDEVTSERRVGLFDANGVPADSIDNGEYKLGYADSALGQNVYLTGSVANGVLSTTNQLTSAGTFNVTSVTGGYTIGIGDQYLGYDIDGTNFLPVVSDLDYVWTIDGETTGLSLVAGNYYNNRKVSVQGTVIGYSNNILYLQDITEVDGGNNIEYGAINVFTGMSPIPSKYTKVNTYVEVKGLALDSQFGFQITDTNFPRASGYSDNESSVILTADENNDIHQFSPLEMSAAEVNKLVSNKDLTYYNTYIKVTDPVTVEGGYVDGSEATLYLSDVDFDAYLTFTYAGDPGRPNWIWDIDDFKGQSFYLEGVFTLHKSTTNRIHWQINPNNADGLQWINQAA